MVNGQHIVSCFWKQDRPNDSRSGIARISIQLTTCVTIQDSVSRIVAKKNTDYHYHGFFDLSQKNIISVCQKFWMFFSYYFLLPFSDGGFYVTPRPTCSLLVCSPGSSQKLSSRDVRIALLTLTWTCFLSTTSCSIFPRNTLFLHIDIYNNIFIYIFLHLDMY